MATPPSHSQSVLPNSKILLLESIERDDNGFTLQVQTSQLPRCPDCGELSRSRHSHYVRRLQDLPWQGCCGRIRLKARRFRCRNPGCRRKVFVERLPEVALPHARQTRRLADIVRLIGFVVGGLPGSRLLARLAITTSDDTVLRRVKMRALAHASDDSIRTLGVDDWAWRKGQDYGTILVDLERHRVVDLLPGRSAEELADWLTQHPTVKVMPRSIWSLRRRFPIGRARRHTGCRSFSPRVEYVGGNREGPGRTQQPIADSCGQARRNRAGTIQKSAVEANLTGNTEAATPATSFGALRAGRSIAPRRTFSKGNQSGAGDSEEDYPPMASDRAVSGTQAAGPKTT